MFHVAPSQQYANRQLFNNNVKQAGHVTASTLFTSCGGGPLPPYDGRGGGGGPLPPNDGRGGGGAPHQRSHPLAANSTLRLQPHLPTSKPQATTP